MVYRKRPDGPWWSKVVEVSGASLLASTGTKDREVAVAIEAWHRQLRVRRDPAGVLRAIVDRAITLAEAYSLDESGTVAHLAAKAEAPPTDLLATYRDAYVQRCQQRGWAAKSVRQWQQQMRTLYPHGLTALQLTPVAISARLDALRAPTGATRNRYRAALSGFCRFLVSKGEIERNPVSDVEAMPERPREGWHTREQLAAALGECSQPTRAIVALMAGGGFEWSAITKCTPARIDLRRLVAHAEGGKTRWRNRHVRLRAWVRPHVEPVLAGVAANARLFVVARRTVMTEWKRAQEAAGVPLLTLHDNRHTHAVHLVQDGETYRAVAPQLGHKTEALVISTYGRRAVTAQSYRVLGHERPVRRRRRRARVARKPHA